VPDEQNDDVVDAEFTEVDDDSHAPKPFSSVPRRDKEWGSLIFLGCIVIGGIYWAVSAWSSKPKQESEPWPPGFEDLIGCSYTASIDGTKELNLLDNGTAVFYDKSIKEGKKYRMIDGNWTFDQNSKHYTVTLDGASTVYSIVEPAGWGSCLLVRGELTAVDLSAAWFAIPSDPDSADDP